MANTKRLLTRFDEVNMKLGEDLKPGEMEKLLDEQGKLQDAIEAANGWDLDRTLEIAMDALRLPPADAEVTKLSGGERRRVALCRVLLERPDMLLLDEPTNHLDAESVAWLEHHLHEYPGTVVAVTHDRYFLDNVAGWILELDRGAGIPWEGNYSSWLDQKRKRLEGEEKAESARQRTLARELEWVRASPRARQAKSKARLAAYEELLAEETAKREDSIEISIPPGPRLGDLVVKADKLKKAYGDNVLIEDLTFNLPRGGIVGVIGPNGAGKTTLFRMMTGQEKPDGGTLRIGDTVKLAYVDQSRDALDGDKTAFDEIAQGAEILEIGKRKIPARAYVVRVQLQGRPTSRSGSRTCQAASATAFTSRSCCARAATCCCWTSRPTISTSTRCGRWRTRCSRSRAARSSSATIAGSWTASRRTSWRSRATARWSGSRATTRTTRPIEGGVWARPRISRTASATRSSYIETMDRGRTAGVSSRG